MNFPFDKNIILENEVALLRPITEADFEHLISIALNEKDLLQYSPMPIYSDELLKQYIDNSIQYRMNKERYVFSVFDKRINTYAGSTSFLNISNTNDRIELGATWYGKAFQRTGLNRNCKYLLLQFAFENLNVHRVEIKTDERNIASRIAIEKIGGKYEGTLREHTLMYDSFRRNTVYYSILKNEWEEMKANFLTLPKIKN